MSEARGHVVLCGMEGLSVRTLEELDRMGEPVVMVAPKGAEPRRLELARAVASRIVDGDPRDPAVLRDAVYDVVARRRYAWFGRKDECMIPSPALRARFVD